MLATPKSLVLYEAPQGREFEYVDIKMLEREPAFVWRKIYENNPVFGLMFEKLGYIIEITASDILDHFRGMGSAERVETLSEIVLNLSRQNPFYSQPDFVLVCELMFDVLDRTEAEAACQKAKQEHDVDFAHVFGCHMVNDLNRHQLDSFNYWYGDNVIYDRLVRQRGIDKFGTVRLPEGQAET